MTIPAQDLAASAYNQLVKTFNRCFANTETSDGNPLPQQLMLDIAGYRVCIRSTSRLLHDRLRQPLAHLELADAGGMASVSIDFIDGALTDAPALALPGVAQRSSSEQETQEYQAGPYLFTLHGDSVLTAFNQATHHTVGIVHDPARWPLEHYQQAIFISLYQHLLHRGLYLIHASAVGRHNRAILFSAKSGAGKTTTMLTCLRAGFQFYSDDATLLRWSAEKQIELVPVLGTLNVTKQTLEWFPELAPHASDLVNRTGKRLVMIDDVFPDRIAKHGIVKAIVAPEITNESRSSVIPLSRMALLSELLPFSLDLHNTSTARSHLDFLVEVLDHVPCYRLRLGQTTEGLSNLLEQLLASPG